MTRISPTTVIYCLHFSNCPVSIIAFIASLSSYHQQSCFCTYSNKSEIFFCTPLVVVRLNLPMKQLT